VPAAPPSWSRNWPWVRGADNGAKGQPRARRFFVVIF
jgi:hypothetical protein